MLKASGITKRFGSLVALDAAEFEAKPGEIHALLGENGAGKTTLVNILGAVLRPDSGRIEIGGVALRAGSAADALKAGIAVVHQSPLLFERLSWEQNLALGQLRRASPLVDLASVAASARRLADTLGFNLPPPGATIENCSLGERVRLEVLRALAFDPHVLVLDEPTALLAPNEVGQFLETLKRLGAGGRITVLVTHKLAEALAVADRITVLRRGKRVAELGSAEATEAELARLMVGELPSSHFGLAAQVRRDEPVLRLEALTVESGGRRILDAIDLAIWPGEILGIAGVDGNGQRELVEVLAGLRTASSGGFHLANRASHRGAASIAVIPQDRDLDGLVLSMSLWENLILGAPYYASSNRWGRIDRNLARARCAELIERFQIHGPDGAASQALHLSGGNRQRFEIARALAGAPKLLVAHDVSRGLDLAAAATVRRVLADFAAGGGAAMLISSDLDELFASCGRIAVLSRGRLRELAWRERSAEVVGQMMAGVEV